MIDAALMKSRKYSSADIAAAGYLPIRVCCDLAAGLILESRMLPEDEVGKLADAVVLLGACDKTVPAQLMGAASANKPAIQLIGGPQMTGRYKDHRVGACTDCRKFWMEYRAGRMGQADLEEVEGRLVTTAGSCAVMGTASTMAAIAEALGMTLPGTAAIPAVHADRLRAAKYRCNPAAVYR